VNPLEALRGALDNLASHKLRSALTMLGMIFGVGAVIAMLSIGSGAERQALEMIDRLGVRNLLVRNPKLEHEELQEIRKKSVGVSLRDARAIVDAVPGVAVVAPRVEIRTYKVLAASGKTEAHVFGVDHRYSTLTRLPLADGRFLDPRDEADHAQVAVVGTRAARDLFGFASPLGRPFKINDVWFEVVGVLAQASGSGTFQGVALGSADEEIYVPVTTALRKFHREPLEAPLDEIVVQLAPSESATLAGEALETLLDRLHAGVDDWDLIVPEALLEQSRRTQRLFNIVMGCIAGISLLVGGIGIMNIMLATVLERTREIGVRRAVGAKRTDVRVQFLIEAFAISVLGGLAGIGMGVAIALGVAAYAGWPTVVTAISILVSTGVSMGVGIVSGIYPAVRASNLDPIDALRYE
jgi:putative ABC transport system permease protein